MAERGGIQSTHCVTINLLSTLIQSYSVPSQNKDTVLQTVSPFSNQFLSQVFVKITHLITNSEKCQQIVNYFI